MLYFIHRVDKPGVHELRMATRPAHMEFAEGLGDTLYFAGPTMNDDGEMPDPVPFYIKKLREINDTEDYTLNVDCDDMYTFN